MTAALDALARIDDGFALAGDRDLAALFDRHCQWDARPCLICGDHGGPECTACLIAHDELMRRTEDI